MSIKQIKVWAVDCDGCGEVFTSMEYGSEHFEDEDAAIEQITDYDWVVIRLDPKQAFCEACASERKPTGDET